MNGHDLPWYARGGMWLFWAVVTVLAVLLDMADSLARRRRK